MINRQSPTFRKRGAVEFKTDGWNRTGCGEKPISEYQGDFRLRQNPSACRSTSCSWRGRDFPSAPLPAVDCRKEIRLAGPIFAKAVEGNWYHLWFHDVSTDQFSLTSNGLRERAIRMNAPKCAAPAPSSVEADNTLIGLLLDTG